MENRKETKMEGLIYLEDGTVFRGTGFGCETTKVGELIFNTSMVGYQSLMTDPAVEGQIMNMTYPLIGNYGINDDEYESDKVHAFGLVVKDLCEEPSNSCCTQTLDAWMKEAGIPGVEGIDTRMITRKIRNEGTFKCVISTEGISYDKAKEICDSSELDNASMKATSANPVKVIGNGEKDVAVYDFGITASMINALLSRNCKLHIFPYGTTAEEILAINPDGLFLSSGPGDPAEATEAIEQIKKLDDIPTMGVGLGHQVLTLAHGGATYKLKYGHRGCNYGVYDKDTGRSYITSQGHGYAVSDEKVILQGMEITHINLNDSTVEGIRHLRRPAFSVQFHPDPTPGDVDSRYLYNSFIELMEKGGAR